MYAVFLYFLSFRKPDPDVYPRSQKPTAAPTAIADTTGRINLNTATAEELDTLPGIGEKTAAAIIEMRSKLGGFRYPEDLLLVHGIGEKKLEAIYDLIYIK